MEATRSLGRKVGVLLLVQMAMGLVLPFMLLSPAFVSFPGFLNTFGENPWRARSAVFISLLGSALTVALAIALWPVLRKYSERIAITLALVCGVSCVLDIVQDASVMSMLSLSDRFAGAGGADGAAYQMIGAAVASTRRWAHYTQLIGFAAWMFTFYVASLRLRLLPRSLAVVALVAVVSQFIGVTLMAFLGLSQITLMAMPLGVVHFAAGVWLVIKGFDDKPGLIGNYAAAAG